MTAPDWRTWLYERLDAALTVPVKGAGSLTENEDERPFIVVHLDGDTPDVPGTAFSDATLWVHDKPGSYLRIDETIRTIRGFLDGPAAVSGGCYASWIGDSADLVDDGEGTIVRTTTYRLAGRS